MMKFFNSLPLYIYIGSKDTHSIARFTLADIDITMSKDQLTVKKEKISSSLPRKRSTIDLTVKTLGSYKRNNFECACLSLESLGAEEALLKLVSFLQAVSVGFILRLIFYFAFC